MVVATRLLMGGGGSFYVPRVFQLTSSPQGGWPTLGGAPFSYNGYTYFGYPSNAGGIFVGIFNESTGAVSETTLAANGSTTNDQHNKPGLLRRSSDNKLVAAYCDHAASTIYLRVSTNSLDSDPTVSGGWGTATNIDPQVLGTAYTYPALYEFGTDILLWLRDQDGAGNNWELVTHTLDTSDLSTGWSILTNLIYGTRYYAVACQPSSTRLDFFVCNGSYAEDFASLRHFYRSGTTYHKSDGTSLGSPPFAFTDLTLVYNGATAGVRAPADAYNNGSEIAVVFPVQTGTPSGHLGEDEDYIYCRASVGSTSWTNRTVATAVGALTFEFTEGSLAIDSADINHLIVSRRAFSSIGEPWRLYDYRTSDSGVNWAQTIRSTLSSDSVMYPWSVRNYSAQLTDVALFGTFTTQSVFNSPVQGYGVPA